MNECYLIGPLHFTLRYTLHPTDSSRKTSEEYAVNTVQKLFVRTFFHHCHSFKQPSQLRQCGEKKKIAESSK